MDIPFLGYALDCILSGTVNLREQRMADLVRTRDVIAVNGLAVEAIEDGRRLHPGQLDLAWDDLVVVSATGPRGDPAQRLRPTVGHPVRVAVGPYEIAGYLQAPVGVDPINHVRRQRVIVLNFAAVRVQGHDGATIHAHQTLLLNGRHNLGVQVVPDLVVRQLVAQAWDPLRERLEPAAVHQATGGLTARLARGGILA